MKLPNIGFWSGPYERPTQKWVCGKASEDGPCHLGPDKSGQCQTNAECAPQLQGMRWVCTRPSSCGGPCEEGPFPDGRCANPVSKCQPTRGLRAKRALISFWASLFTIGMLLLWLPSHEGPAKLNPKALQLNSSFISPGPLINEHATFPNDNCENCHTAPHKEPASLISALVTSESMERETHLCLRCHQMGEHALQIHSHSPKALVAVTKKSKQKNTRTQRPLRLSMSAWFAGNPSSEPEHLSCATCHREHQGRNFSLQHMGNLQCQLCHVVQFSSLANGHPPFSDYPWKRRTRIKFDHNSHLDKHFSGYQKQAPAFSNEHPCEECHTPISSGQQMSLKSFETACANCHAKEIFSADLTAGSGIPFIRLPGLDLMALNESKNSVGKWPESQEEKLTPFMELLLQGKEPGLQSDFALTANFEDFTDLEDATKQEIAAVRRIIWAVKDLFFDIISHGHQALISRLQTAWPQINASELADLIGQLPIEVILAAQQEWLPNLENEMLGKKVDSPEKEALVELLAQKDKAREKMVAQGGWYRQDTDFTLRYRPVGHADPFMRTWLDISSRFQKQLNAEERETIFDVLSDDKESPGRCLLINGVTQ